MMTSPRRRRMRSPRVAAVELELVVVIPDLEEVVDVVVEVPAVLVAHVDPVDQGVKAGYGNSIVKAT